MYCRLQNLKIIKGRIVENPLPNFDIFSIQVNNIKKGNFHGATVATLCTGHQGCLPAATASLACLAF
jgi:hypothetical protein